MDEKDGCGRLPFAAALRSISVPSSRPAIRRVAAGLTCSVIAPDTLTLAAFAPASTRNRTRWDGWVVCRASISSRRSLGSDS